MDQRLENVFLVHLKSTDETYQSFICARFEAVLSVLKARRITVEHYSNDGFWDFRDPIDKSQSAIVVRKPLVY